MKEDCPPVVQRDCARFAAQAEAAMASVLVTIVDERQVPVKGARLLVDGSMKVATVGHEIGYESEAAFSRAFKKAVGVSPAAWRGMAAAAT